MRALWAAIAILAALGLWFVLSDRPAQRPQRPAISDAPSRPADVEPTPPTAPTSAPSTVAETSASRSSDPQAGSLGDTLLAGLGVPSASASPSASAATPASRPPVVSDSRSPDEVTRRIDARTLELDGRFRVIGNGGPDDPYRVSWELLTSAEPFIDPAREAMTTPPWVRAINGTYIEISAYYSTAVRVSTTRNVLLTFNRWDGCCIGLPPTPFDAIDATLAKPLDMQGLHLFRYGTFRGRLVVEPFAVGAYLLGLYRLEDASFVAQ
jgi:hypothetical protein